MSNATIADVAKKSGFGVGTVSRVINNAENVSDETREKVLEVIRELNYIPNPIAKNLKAASTNNIAYVATSIDNVTLPDIIRGINSIAAPEGYTIFLVETGFSPEKEIELVHSLVQRYVDGIILLSSITQDTKKYHAYIESLSRLKKQNMRIPVVQIAVPALNRNVDSITFNDENCAYRAVEHLLEIGRKNIAYISVSKESGVYKPRLDGYIRAMVEAGLSDNIQIVEGGFTVKSGYEATQQLLDYGAKPDAVFAGCDGAAIGSLAACKDFGLNVPKDIAVVGIDDSRESYYVDPKLSTIRVPRFQMGVEAARLLLKRIRSDSPDYEAQHIVLDTELLIRESTLKSAASKRGIQKDYYQQTTY